jgi:hypothetical protein
MTTEHVSVPRELFDMAREQIERQRLAALEYGLIAVAEAHSYALHKIDAILSRATPSDTRCTARVKEVPKDKRPSGPANPPKWCCLPAGHDGPHKCNFGGMTAPVPFRDSDEIEWVPLKSTATSAPRVVTDDDVMRACRAYNNPPGPMKPSGYATPHMMRAALESFATSLPAARVPDGWKLVPVEPTSEQLEASCNSYWGDGWDEHDDMRDARIIDARNMYDAALASAPQAGETK